MESLKIRIQCPSEKSKTVGTFLTGVETGNNTLKLIIVLLTCFTVQNIKPSKTELNRKPNEKAKTTNSIYNRFSILFFAKWIDTQKRK